MNTYLKRLTLAVTTLMTASPGLVMANNDHQHTEKNSLPTIQVNRDAPINTFERDVDLASAELYQAKTLNDLFRLDPAIRVVSGATRNGQKIVLRGVEDLNLNIQIDGARQGANLFHHQGRLQIDPALYKQVRVFSGSAPADAGPGALGGSVQFETVDAQDWLRPGERIGARVGGQYESARDLGGLTTSVYGQLDDYTGLLAYMRRTQNSDLRAGGGETVPSTAGSHNNYLLKLSMLDRNDHSLRISAQASEDLGGQFRANFPDASNQLSGGSRASDNQRIYEQRQAINYGYNPNDDRIDLQVTLYHSENGLNIIRAENELALTESYGMNLFNTSRFSLGASQHALTYGSDYFRDENRYRNRTTGDARSEFALNHGVYLQDRMSYGPVRLSGGLRYDSYYSRLDNQYRNAGDGWSPNLSGEWDVLTGQQQVTLFAGYGESLRGSRLNQAYWLSKYPRPGQTFQGLPVSFELGKNGKIKPERAMLQEAGVRWHSDDLFTSNDHAGLELTFYRTEIKDYWRTSGEGPNRPTTFFRNAQDPRLGPGELPFKHHIYSEGYELRGHWGLNRVLMEAAYSHNKLRGYDGLPADTTGASARVGSSVGDKLVLNGLWQAQDNLALGYTFTGVEKLRDVRPGRPEKPGYITHDLQVQWQPAAVAKQALRLTAALENIFDTRYADHATVRDVVSGEEVTTLDAGRNLRLSAEWQF
ncbi:TonB-dependent receptor plug domain-containing protein [Thiomicrospira cyclica]|uniref:TonB-dependent receptor n=1 Tax=Thiomicrospira cyclica (strain DSM 14477 / JCM 11371 / ALM1) TaxID=717773 RepID=F6DBN6_THICA|nr:TonB-dependent receptor plug domain-containing protein [Thiomicrospira cyclica]AEG32438.1 TonB-dependent receptor [Thiomicrospira cyclica ALM1]